MATGSFFIFTLVAVFASALAIQCPPEWSEWGDHCYKFENQIRTTWAAAEQHCIDGGGHLVTIDNADENTFLYNWWVSQLAPLNGNSFQYFWTGYSKGDGGNWGWSNDASSSFTRWGAGQPDNLVTTKCAVMKTTLPTEDGRWDNVNCETTRAFVCESRDPNLFEIIGAVADAIFNPFGIFGKK